MCVVVCCSVWYSRTWCFMVVWFMYWLFFCDLGWFALGWVVEPYWFCCSLCVCCLRWLLSLLFFSLGIRVLGLLVLTWVVCFGATSWLWFYLHFDACFVGLRFGFEIYDNGCLFNLASCELVVVLISWSFVWFCILLWLTVVYLD